MSMLGTYLSYCSPSTWGGQDLLERLCDSGLVLDELPTKGQQVSEDPQQGSLSRLTSETRVPSWVTVLGHGWQWGRHRCENRGMTQVS